MAIEESYIEEKEEIRQTEYQLLGILLQHTDKIDEVADELKVKHFQSPQPQLIYEMLLDQFQKNNQISRTKLFMQLKKEGIINNPEETINDLTSGFSTVEELKPTIDIIKKNYQRQLLVKAADKIKDMTRDTDKDISEYQSQAQELIFEATNESTDLEKHIYNMEDALMESFESYLDRKHNKLDIGLRSGFISLDNLIGGFKKSHLIVLAASTSMGKTAFAINIAKNILKRDVSCAMISLEMEAQEIIDRMVIQEAQVNGWKYNQGETSDDEDRRISKALDNLHELPLMISDERGLNVAQIRARLRKFKAQMGELGLVVVDYLQMIQLPEKSHQNTSRAVGEVVLQLRNLASELEVPIILISQISRSFTSRSDKRPVLSDLRDSGNIEEVSDSVIFLYRHDHTSAAAREKAEAEGTVGETEIIVAKQRTGQTGSIKLQFQEDYIRFVDPENIAIEESMPNA